jgi:hypothetical protein
LPPAGDAQVDPLEESRIPLKLGAARVCRVKIPQAPPPVPETESPDEYLRTLSTIRDPSRAMGFQEGVRFIIRVAEIRLANSLGLANRQELSKHGDKVPAWWMITVHLVHRHKPPYDVPELPAPQGALPTVEQLTEAQAAVKWVRSFGMGERILWQPADSSSWLPGRVTRIKNNCLYFKLFGDPLDADSRFLSYKDRHSIKLAAKES